MNLEGYKRIPRGLLYQYLPEEEATDDILKEIHEDNIARWEKFPEKAEVN